jgi:site-specific DNA-methyltransferase (adenine-specific)
VLHFDRALDNGRLHPTEKPLPLLEYLIEKSSQPGEVVCDPFAGVASTLLAAKNTGRKYIGIEIEKQWYDLGLARLSKA